MAYTNSVDLAQTAPEGAVWSGSTLFVIHQSNLRNNCIKSKIEDPPHPPHQKSMEQRVRNFRIFTVAIARLNKLVVGITKTFLYNFDPLKSHFYIVKLGFTGVYIIFLILLKNIEYGYSLELPQQGSSNKYPQSMFRLEIWKKYQNFLSENFPFFMVVKFSIYMYLNRHVFVMHNLLPSTMIPSHKL